MFHRVISPAVALAVVALFSAPASAQDAPVAASYICPPCGSTCHGEEYDAPGTCSSCGMEFVESTTVPRVAIFVFDGVELSNFAAPAGVFSQSGRVLVHTVADTTDEVSSSELLTFAPRFSFEDAPKADVLIIVGGANIMGYAGDTLVTDWIAEAAESSDHVLCVGLGVLFLQPTGVLDGKTVPVPPVMAQNMERLLPGVKAADHHTVARFGKYHVALHEEAASRAALAILAELTDHEVATQTAESLGFEFHAPPAREGDEP